MIKITLTALAVTLLLQPQWHLSMSEAQQIARKEHRHILLNFSGSDWCGPCIELRKEVFDAGPFAAMADSSLVLVNADFPRMKKDQLSRAQQEANDRLADQYDPNGIFPLTLLLTADGKVIRQWQGNPGLKPQEFATEVQRLIAADPAR
ncbi:MAG TPA: thioredoxin family protein [Puia sp.]|nr:thioredoxin family protein [Puia sp.]